MSEIYLADLLRFSEKEIDLVKIKLNQWNGVEDPMELYKKNPEIVNTKWLFWRADRRYFEVGQIAICFLRLTYDTWLLTTIKRVSEELDVHEGINYRGEELEEYRKYFGRVIVKYHKTNRATGVYFKSVCHEMTVNQILTATYDGFDFPGYDNVRLTYDQLETIVNLNKRDWVSALENQKAVYLIVDRATGKKYVGSATSENGMLLSRWKSYVSNGHGGNVGLISLVEEKGMDYVKKNFQYVILENYNARMDDQHILKRETWWKETLLTRGEFGYNQN